MRTRWFNVIPLLTLLLGMLFPMAAQAAPISDPPAVAPFAPSVQEKPPAEIEHVLLDKLATEGTADFVVVMAEQADLSAAYKITDWSERGWYVYNTLREVANRTQASIMSYAKQNDLEFKTFFTTNSIHIQQGTLSSAQAISRLPGVALIRESRVVQLDPAMIEGPQLLAPTSYGWNLDALEPDSGLYGLQAAQVWDQYGIKGSGIVVANIDTGVTYQHEALERQYRGNLGGSYDHDFNWYAPSDTGAGQCGGNAATSPCDHEGHGSGTAGIMVGETEDLTEQLGVAPAAKWIACMGCDSGTGCSEEALTGCADWMVAPCPIGADPGDPTCNPDMRPNIVNNSWGGGYGDEWYRGYVQAWTAAGMFPAFSAGNDYACAAVGSPGDNPEAFGTAAHGSNGQNIYAGGPSLFFPNPSCDPEAYEVDPHLNAPTYGRTAGNAPGSYYNLSGTSGASPHTAGAVALIWSANPDLIGDIWGTFNILEQTADRTSTQSWREGDCGKPACAGSDPYPNYEYGWGYLDALAAVDEALQMADNGTLQGTVTDAATTNPVADARVVATLNVTRSWQTTTDALGEYSMLVFSGTYTVGAYKYGYLPAMMSDVDVAKDVTTTLNLALTPVTFYEVSGQVTDATTGWPLYAHITINGDPVDPLPPDNSVWTDPATGEYSVMLAEGVTYTFDVEARVPGYNSASTVVGPLTSDVVQDFALEANMGACTAPGYHFTDGLTANFEDDAFPPVGWTVVNNGGSCVWVGDDPGGRGNLTGGTGKFAIADSDKCGSGKTMNTELVSPISDVSGLTQVNLSFAYDYNFYSAGERAAVDVSADGGATWVNVAAWSTADQRGLFSQDVTAILGGSTQARVRFHYYAPGWDYWWQVDDVLLGNPVCNAPTDGGLVVGNVYDANVSLPLTGAEVANDMGDTATAAFTPDPAVDDAFYTLFSPSGAHDFTASNDGFLDDVATVNVVDGATVVQDFYLDAGYLVATPSGVEVTVEAGGNVKRWLSLENQGAMDALYNLLEVPGGFIPNGPLAAMALPAPDSERRFELALGDAPAQGVAAEPWMPNGAVQLIVDDGSAEDAIGLTGGGQFLWLNRFTPDPAEYPFTLDQVWMLFRDSANVGEAIELVIWEDTDGDGDPGTGATFRSAENVTVLANDNTTWSVYDLSSPVFFAGPGDVVIGAVNRDDTGTHPAAIDTTASQVRSWVGLYSGDPPDPPTLPPDADWGTIDSMGFAGNWMIRGSGVTGTGGADAISWLTETPISGTVAADDTQNVLLTFDAGIPEANQPGTYYGSLRVKTDTPYPDATVPVTMNVTAPAGWGKLEGQVTSLGYCDLESNLFLPEEAEITIESAAGAMWTVYNDADGMYMLWLDPIYNPLTITVTAPEHATAVVTGVNVSSGTTTTVDIGLRWLVPCVTAEPIPLEMTLELGYTATVPFTLTNAGAGDMPFDLAEANGGFTIMAPLAPTTIPTIVGASNPAWAESGEAVGEPVIGAPAGGAAPEAIGPAWETMAPLPSGRVFNAVVADTNGYVYVIGGTSDAGGSTSTNTTFRYNTATNAWDTMATMPMALNSIDGAVINGKIYIPGDATTANTFVYDIAANTWSTLATTGGYTARSQYQVVALGTDLYVLGGIVGSSTTNQVWILDTTTGAWSAGVPMQKVRTSFSAGATGDEIYVAGGINFDGSSFTPDMTAEKFDGTSWSYIANVPNGGGAYTRWSYNADAVGSDGLWLAAGRRDADWNVLNHAGYYNPATDTWTDSPTIPTLAQGRVYMEGDVASDGYFYVIGGRNSAGDTIYTTNERLEVGYAGGGGGGGAIPWLAEDPDAGTVAADSTFPVDITFDASAAVTEVTQPGEYFGTLYVMSNDPYAASIVVPVTMTVTAPATWGKLMGTVTSLGYCDADPTLVEGADVLIEASDGTTWTLMTDEMGTYAVWLDAMYSPMTITVSAPEHEKGEVTGVGVSAGVTTTEDFDLRWLVPCVSPNPAGLSVALDMGDTATAMLYVENNGAVEADWELSEANRDPGFVPLAPSAGEDVLVVAYDTAAATAMEAALTANGYTYLRVDRTTFQGMAVPDLLAYKAVFYAGGYSSDSWAKAMAYLDAGGSFLIADNDFLYSSSNTTFYQTYLQATYVSDSGSAGVLTGVDIMAGVNPDISLDPYPDDFAISGADAVGIFVAPSANWSGLRIARAGYQAICLSWDFDDTAAVADETAIIGRAMTWLAPAGPVDIVPWMAQDPLTGTVVASASNPVTVTFDASVAEVTQPGDYLAWINVDAPADPVMGGFAVPVTMTVNPPATWGRLDGTVYSLGYCDAEVNPVEGADVVIENGVEVTLTTGVDGMYGYWLAPGTYTVTATAPDHTVGEVVVTVSAGVSQTQNFSLRWLAPCVTATPDAINDTLAMGDTSDHPLTILNDGAGDANFSFTEWYEGYTIASVLAPSAPAGKLRLVTIGDNAFTTNPKASSAVSVPPPAKARPEGVYALTHSLSQTIMDGNSAACGSGGVVADNDFIRVFDLGAFGITEYFDVQTVEVGIQTAVAGSGGVQPGTINLYTLDGPLTWANMTLIGTADFDIHDGDALSVVSVPVTATAPAGSVLVVDFSIPDGQAQGHSFWPGSNNLGQTAPSYIASVACGMSDPVDTADIGFPDMHLVINVIGYTPESVDLPWLIEDPLTGVTLGDNTSAVTVTLDAGQVPLPGTYLATLKVETDDPVNPRYPVAVAMTVTLPATYGKIEGTVYGMGYCDDEMLPLANADVLIEDSDGMTITVTTNVGGVYEVWRDEAGSPYTVTATFPDHLAGMATGVVVTGTETTVRDLSLRSIIPCASVAPDSIHEVVTLGMSTTVPMTVSNTGAGDLNWKLIEAGAGFDLLHPTSTVIQAAGDAPIDARVAPAQIGFSAPIYTPANPDILMDEGFEGGVVPPAGWTQIVNNTVETWGVDDYSPHSGDFYANVLYDYDQDEWLLSPELALSEGTLSFWSYGSLDWCRDTNDNCDLNVWIVVGPEVDDGDDIYVGTADDDWVANWTWAQSVFDLTPLLPGGPVRIGFQYWGDDGAEAALDDILLDGLTGVPWLSEDPEDGVTPAEDTLAVSVTLDAGVPEVTQPGDYFATLTLKSDDPGNPGIAVPVTMTVTAPDTWGKLAGTVTGLGYCDVNPQPLEGAVVFIESAVTQTVLAEVALLEEAFEGAFPPAGWAVVNNGGTCTWVGNDPNGDGNLTGGSGSFADADSNACGSGSTMDTDLISPPFDVSGLSQINLSFAYDYYNLSSAEVAAVDVSADNGTTWVNVVTWNSSQRGPATFSQDVTALLAGSTQARIRFHYHAPGWDWWWQVDDVEVTTLIEQIVPVDWTLTTDVSGTYGIWLDEMYSPLTVTVSYEAGYDAQPFTGVTVVSGTTTPLDANLRWLQPCVSTSDTAIEVTVPWGSTDTYPLTLLNNGAVDTPFRLTEQDLGVIIAGPQAVVDAFGYAVEDSDSASGPVYDFVDISAFGTPVALDDDDFAGPLPVGFDFPFYGASAGDPNLYDEVFINSNGFLSFGAGSTDLSNDVLPNLQTPNNIIALMWDDLVPGTAYYYTFDSCPYANNTCLVVQYEGFTHIGGEAAGTWQAILFRNGNILVQFADAGEYEGAGSTTGIENEFGTDGITYAADAPALEDALAVCFAYPGNSTTCASSDVPWLDESVIFGDILADGSTPVTLYFDASVPEVTGPGAYMASLDLLTDDPYNWRQVIPVTMTVERPATWGKIEGTVLGWNHCDLAAIEVEGATVFIESANGVDTWALTTDISGTYGLWLDAAHSPVTVTVTHDDYVTLVESVPFVAGDTPTEVTHELRMNVPCFNVTPTAIEFTVTRGHTYADDLLLTNDGAAMLDIAEIQYDAWMMPDMTAGTIDPDSTDTLNVVFSAVDMAIGQHVGELVFLSNDPMQPTITVPVTMTVLTPTLLVDVYATPPSVTYAGDLITYTIVVTNTSDGPVDIDLLNVIPANTTYVVGSVTGGLSYVQPTTTDDYVMWSGTLPLPGTLSILTFSFVVRVAEDAVVGSTIDNTVTVETAGAVFTDVESVLVSEHVIGEFFIYLPLVMRNAQ